MMKLSTVNLAIVLLIAIATIGEARGLIAHYPFFGNANDETFNMHDGAVIEASLANDRRGDAECAFRFNGMPDSYIDIGELGEINDVSTSVWYKSEFGNQATNIFGSSTNLFPYDNHIFKLTVEFSDVNSRLYYLLSTRTGSENELYGYADDIPNDGNWHHIVFTRELNTVNIYLDGIAWPIIVVHGDNTQSVDTHKGYFIGADNADDSWLRGPFIGSLDDIRIYDYALSEAQAQDLFIEGELLFNFVPGDVNGDCHINGIDVVYMVNFLKGGPGLIRRSDCE